MLLQVDAELARAAAADWLAFYAILAALPRARWTELFLERGWVPYVITLVSAWALLLVGNVQSEQHPPCT